MRIIKLSKELGVPYEKILYWCAMEGMPYTDPEEEITPGHGARVRAAFVRPAPKPEKEGDLEDMDPSLDDIETTFGTDSDLSLDDLPQTLEELEALEGMVFKNAAKPPPPKPKADRFLVKAILKKFGVENKGAIKRIRKLLPEHVSRLFSHESLAEEQSAQFQQALREKIVFWCGDKVCKRLLLEFHKEKELIETQATSVCTLCEGSSIRRGMEVMAKACRENEVRRVLIIGGSPASHNEINKHTPAGLSFKLIQGDVSRDRQRAAADLNWCDVAVIWAGTILGHEVSNNYIRSGKEKVVVFKRRSIEALCETVVQWLKRRNKSPN